jgi:hypothetical protein
MVQQMLSIVLPPSCITLLNVPESGIRFLDRNFVRDL